MFFNNYWFCKYQQNTKNSVKFELVLSQAVLYFAPRSQVYFWPINNVSQCPQEAPRDKQCITSTEPWHRFPMPVLITDSRLNRTKIRVYISLMIPLWFLIGHYQPFLSYCLCFCVILALVRYYKFKCNQSAKTFGVWGFLHFSINGLD